MGGTMGGSSGTAGVYNIIKKAKGEYWKAVQKDLNKRGKVKSKAKDQKVGR